MRQEQSECVTRCKCGRMVLVSSIGVIAAHRPAAGWLRCAESGAHAEPDMIQELRSWALQRMGVAR